MEGNILFMELKDSMILDFLRGERKKRIFLQTGRCGEKTLDASCIQFE